MVSPLSAGSRQNGVIGYSLLVSFHPETPPCHSEPFERLRTGSAKNLCGIQ